MSHTEGPQSLRKKHNSWTEEGKAEREPHRPLVPPSRTPQPVTLSRDWVLKHRLLRSVLEGGIGLAAWSQTEELGIHAPRAGVWSTSAEETQKEVLAHRSSKASLLGRSRGGAADHHRNILMHAWTLECCIFE